ncbi:AAA family ATPase [Flavobacterium sp. SUN046]|uniref:AAA family ATPase n=1 Tax=Flavobacterium sp. SUN046 TaxID=3002440 RepID=UPI002DB5A5D1|nr:AAA family ATPase [Flavobacterium sp. SUN046]MEC4049773.1 AAA family ATPase [Flavobacterium sp. SUN046]
MKNVFLKSLTLVNFKGMKKQEIIFNESITNIFGANGTGKTTINDAFLFLLFGKNSEDRKDFNIKNTKDTSLNKSDHEVEALLMINGDETTVKKVYKEKWTKKRESTERTFDGNVTECFWNGVPMQLKDFQSRVVEIIPENVFKIITNPLYFNQMKWQDQRTELLRLHPISNDDIAEKLDAESNILNTEKDIFKKLLEESKKHTSLEEWKKMLNASIKKSKDEIKLIPARIDEVKRGMPEALDFEALNKDLEVANQKLSSIDSQIKNKANAFDEILKKRNAEALAISNLKNKITSIEVDTLAQASKQPDNTELDFLTKLLAEKKQELTTAQNALSTLNTKLSGKRQELLSKENEIVNLRKQWNDENAKELVFDDNDFHCPTCKREFESGDVDAKKDQMFADFKSTKNQTLTSISARGGHFTKEKTDIETEIKDFENRIENGKNIVTNLEAEIKGTENTIDIVNSQEFAEVNPQELYETLIAANTDYNFKKEELAKLEDSLTTVPEVNDERLENAKLGLVMQIDEIKSQLGLQTQIETANKRVAELEEQQKTLSQEIANVEKKESLISKFNKSKIDTLENEINKKFKLVKFKMFDTQINGGEVECCIAMIDGVPYSDANKASQFNAGIDIINTLSEFYGVSAPIFFDNAESVHTITETNSQLIRLVVSEEDKKLRVA